MTVLARLGRTGALAASILAFAALGAAAQTAPTLTPLHILASPVDDVMPVLYAQRAGLFRQAGLDVTIDRANSGAAAAAAVIGGSVDIGKGNIMSVITAHAHAVPLVIVAPAAIYDPKTPDAALVVAAGSPIRTAHDLVGKVVGVTALNDLSAVATEAWLDAHGGDWRSTQFVEVPYSAQLPQLEAGRVQATVLLKPFINDAVNTGKARVLGLVYGAVSDRFLESVWEANAGYVAAHPDVIARFQRVVAQASAYTNTHPADTVDLLVSFTGLEPQRAALVSRMVNGTVVRADEIQPVIDIAERFNLIAKAFPAQEIISH
ncbi:MAG: ABC transporter substrate-binding protein [Candidatus Lustribacter sp.]|jgi:NitT/TauT family transport system substrate-binding protein